MNKLEHTDIFENDIQIRHIFRCGIFEIDLRADMHGITVEILKSDDLVAECAVDYETD